MVGTSQFWEVLVPPETGECDGFGAGSAVPRHCFPCDPSRKLDFKPLLAGKEEAVGKAPYSSDFSDRDVRNRTGPRRSQLGSASCLRTETS